MESDWEIAVGKVNGVSRRYGDPPFVECRRCHYVGEADGALFDFVDLLAVVPPVGHLLYLILRGGKNKETGLRCPMCDYDQVEMVTEETARARLGNARIEHIIEQRNLRSAQDTRIAVLVALALAGAGYFIFRFLRT